MARMRKRREEPRTYFVARPATPSTARARPRRSEPVRERPLPSPPPLPRARPRRSEPVRERPLPSPPPLPRPRSRRSEPIPSITLTREQIHELDLKAERARADRQAEEIAAGAVKRFKPSRSQWGTLQFVDTLGRSGIAAKRRKGYLVYITSKGKKQLVRSKDEPLRASKIGSIKPPLHKAMAAKTKEFQNTLLASPKPVRLADFKGRKTKSFMAEHPEAFEKQERGLIQGRGYLEPASKANDFDGKVIGKMATSLRDTIESQASNRNFLLRANVLVRLPDGSQRVYTPQIGISKPDHIAIAKGGMKNFVRQRFYKAMAADLAFDGYVTRGSKNHIRRMSVNKGVTDHWQLKDAQGGLWQGHDYSVVSIEAIEWRIEQLA